MKRYEESRLGSVRFLQCLVFEPCFWVKTLEVLESFVDLANSSQVMIAPSSQARQRSQAGKATEREHNLTQLGGGCAMFCL